MGKVLTIIPDVHGRSFWRRAVQDAPEDGTVIFLGDYLDPYPWEEITPGDATRMLQEIIALKMARPDRVVLILGNHDMDTSTPTSISAVGTISAPCATRTCWRRT